MTDSNAGLAGLKVVDLGVGGFDGWLAGKSSNFRRQARRFPRRFMEAGGRIRMTASADERPSSTIREPSPP